MKHARHYEVIKLKEEVRSYGLIYQYGLTCTKDGITSMDDYLKFETLEEATKRCEELNNKIYISDFDEEEVKEFYNSINFQPLYDKINTTIGLQLTYKNELEKTMSKEYLVNIVSNENISDMFLLIKAAWKEFKISTFGTSISVDQEHKDLKFWCSIDYKYRHQDGGMNGSSILSAFYNNRDGWNFITEMERQYL